MAKSTTHRVLGLLGQAEAVEKVEGGFQIGLRMFSMGALSNDALIRDISKPHLERLRGITRKTVHLAVLRHGHSVYLDKLPGTVPSPAVVGGRLPAHMMGVGKALLAFNPAPSTSSVASALGATRDGADTRLLAQLQRIRQTGVAHDRDNACAGLSCIAVPVHVRREATFAVSVSYPSAEGDGSTFIAPLRQTTAPLARVMDRTLSSSRGKD